MADNPKDEEVDQVTQAYENISKKLENLRKGKNPEEDEEEPQGPEEDEELGPLPGTDEATKDEEAPKPTFTPKKDDPLDDETAAEDEAPQPDEKEVDDFDQEEVKNPSAGSASSPQASSGRGESEGPKESAARHSFDRPGSKETDLDDLASEERADHPTPINSFSDSFAKEDEQLRNLHPRTENAFGQTKPGFGSEIGFSKPNYHEEAHPSNYFNRHNTTPPKRGSFLHLIILILIGLAVIGGTVYLLKYQFNSTPSPTPTPTPEATASPAATPTPAIENSKFKIRVLNGTTTSGLARTVSDKLKELGFQIDKTGNAPKQDYKSTEIKVKSSASGLYDQLAKDLGSDYTASNSGELKDSDAADAEVILGGK